MSLIRELKYFGNTLSILIVEDEKLLNSELSSMLSNLFMTVYSAHNGKEGLACYKKYRPDIVLTDISMPRMDGIKMSQQVKTLNKNQTIVVLSAHGDTSYMIELIDIGIEQFVLKPLEKNTLIYKLLKVSENIIYKREFDKFYKQKRKNRVAQSIDSLDKKEKTQEYKLSHNVVKANDFMQEIENDSFLWMAFKDDIPELMKLSEEFSEYIDDIYLHNLTAKIRDSIVYTINSYIRIFSTLDQMGKMISVLIELVNFLVDLDIENLTEENQRQLKILEYINNDITRFLHTVFVYKDNVDIYYLEDSLESSIIQLKNSVLNIATDEEDVDFF